MRVSEKGDIIANSCEPAATHGAGPTQGPAYSGHDLTPELVQIYNIVASTGTYNFAQARCPVPSALNIQAWRERLGGYRDTGLVDFLQFGWPINFDRMSPLCPTYHNHPSADNFDRDVAHYVHTERGHGALLGPFPGPPVANFHVSPLMTRHKKDAEYRRVIIDLSWPKGAAVNDGVDTVNYLDGPATITLPTAEYMVRRILQLGPGAWLYKTDLARGYRQLRVDPLDWPLLGFRHQDGWFLDICPPFGLRSSAMCMQRTAEAICFIHAGEGYLSRPYLDDFGGAEASNERASQALDTLQRIMRELGIAEAIHKVHRPSQRMIWLGILYDSVAMRMSIPVPKMEEIMQIMEDWEGRNRASRREVQSLLGLLQFVASVSPPVRIFTNRMLQCMREMPHRGTDGLSLGFRQDLRFFLDLLPHYNGVRIIDKQGLSYQGEMELDACLTGCGATIGEQYYSEAFPPSVIAERHIIAHLETLNIVVAVKMWWSEWMGKRVKVNCDNTNACLAIQSGRSRDPFLQHCVREIFLYTASHDIELIAVHKPGALLVRADALSRAPHSRQHREIVECDPVLCAAERVRVPPGYFELRSEV